eukprot:scpid47873/ scgid26094/ Dynein alpha chain, flagellar outer arm; DHC alpha
MASTWLVNLLTGVTVILFAIHASKADDELQLHRRTTTSRNGKDFEQGVGDDDGPPSARAGHGMDAWDMYVGEVYLFGGCVNMSNNYTSSFGSLALWHGCTGFSNEVWKMYWDEHSGQISWWRLWSQPNTTRDSYMHRDPFNGESAAYASARAGCSVIGFDSPDSAATTLFVFGGVGLQDGPTTADTWLFDTAQGAWTAVNVSTPPPPRAYHSTVHWKDLMIIFGGLQVTFDVHHYTMYTFAGDVAVFNTTSRRWYTFDDANPSPQWNQEGIMVGHPQALHQSNDAPVPRAYHAASLHSSFANTMFVYGGAAGTGHYYQDWFFDDLWTLEWDSAEALLSGKMTWTRLTPSSETVRPSPLFGQTLMWCNGSELAMMWGMMPNKSAPANATATQTLWRINLNTMTWRKPTGLYQKARAFFATVSIGCGGWLSDGLAGFSGQSELLSDFSEAGGLP